MYDNDDVRYAHNRLVNTLVRYEGKVVEVRDVYHNRRKADPLVVASVGILDEEECVDSIYNYDLTPLKLGFVNFDGGGTAYVTRRALREDWRQGFRMAQASIQYISNPEMYRRIDNVMVAKSAEGIFPTIEEIFERPDDFTTGWCNTFATSRTGEIIYRGFGKVGNFINNTKEFLLDNQFGWVEERLRKAI